MALNTAFEKEICGRCGGSGNHSYNQVDGWRCYGCGGKGERLTKRGKAAAHFFRQSCMKKAGEIVVGDVIEAMRYFAPVTSIETKIQKGEINGVAYEKPQLWITTTHEKFGNHSWVISAETKIFVRASGEDRKRLIDAALAYQADLNKNGTEKKKKAA